MIKISPSLLAADFANLENEIKKVEQAKADMLHIDIMDGHFVPNMTFGPDQIKALKKKTNLPFDIHLMIDNVDEYIPRFVDAGADILTIHVEAVTHLQRSLSLIKSYGIKSGVVLNPSTTIDHIKYVLDDIDMILLMSVNPGFGGGKFIDSIMDKIRETKEYIKDRDIDIEVDGGINLTNAKQCVDNGADVLVVGSYTFNGDVKENITKLREVVK